MLPYIKSGRSSWRPSRIRGARSQKMTIEDFGPDVLNLVTDPENNEPWEDEDGPHSPNWMMSSRMPKHQGTFSLTLRYSSL